jgi:hypothetical protein
MKGKTETILAALKERPGMPIPELAAMLYGDSSRPSQGKTRALIFSLHKQERLASIGTGKWEVV